MPGAYFYLTVQLLGSDTAESLRVLIEDCERVGDLKEAIIAEFKRFKDFDSSELQLLKLVGGSRTLLVPAQTLDDAGVQEGTALEVEVLGAYLIRCLLSLLWTF